MKTKLLFLCLYVLSAKLSASDPLTSSFTIGNKFAYLGTRHSVPGNPNYDTLFFLEQITKDSLINGQKYFVFMRSSWKNKNLMPYEDSSSIFFRRADSGAIYEYDKKMTEEDTLVNFKDSVGTVYYSSGYYIGVKNIENRFGQSYPVMFLVPHDGTSQALTKTYSQLFFITRFTNHSIVEISIDLKAAYVNGIMYGNQNLLSIQPIVKNTLVNKFELFQNYPNPFNPTTIIKYALPKSGHTSVKIYDGIGCEISTLVNEFKESGNYEVSFDASKFASGVYIYKLTSGSYSAIKKMILLK